MYTKVNNSFRTGRKRHIYIANNTMQNILSTQKYVTIGTYIIDKAHHKFGVEASINSGDNKK